MLAVVSSYVISFMFVNCFVMGFVIFFCFSVGKVFYLCPLLFSHQWRWSWHFGGKSLYSNSVIYSTKITFHVFDPTLHPRIQISYMYLSFKFCWIWFATIRIFTLVNIGFWLCCLVVSLYDFGIRVMPASSSEFGSIWILVGIAEAGNTRLIYSSWPCGPGFLIVGCLCF